MLTKGRILFGDDEKVLRWRKWKKFSEVGGRREEKVGDWTTTMSGEQMQVDDR